MKKIAICFMTLILSLSSIQVAVAASSEKNSKKEKEPLVSRECRDEVTVESCRAATQLTEMRQNFLEMLQHIFTIVETTQVSINELNDLLESAGDPSYVWQEVLTKNSLNQNQLLVTLLTMLLVHYKIEEQTKTLEDLRKMLQEKAPDEFFKPSGKGVETKA